MSRIIDVIPQSGGNILKPSAIGVTGCSRFGRGAFVTGAFDQRIALTMPIESGTDGVPIFRGVPGESGAQPLDEVAPRGMFIMENPHIDWLAARSGSMAALGGAEVYKALGVGPNISYWSDVQDATHCAVRPEWQARYSRASRRSCSTPAIRPPRSGSPA